MGSTSIERGDEVKRQIVALQNTDGSFSDPVPNALPEPGINGKAYPSGSLVYDINQDGLDDLILLEGDQTEQLTPDILEDDIKILISNGDGTFRDESDRIDTNTFGNFDERVGVTFLKDFNEDGFQDLIVQRQKPNFSVGVEVYLNDGAGRFRVLAQNTLPDATPTFLPINLKSSDGGLDFIYIDYQNQVTLLEANKSYGPTLIGDSLDNRIVGGGGNEELYAAAGNDVVFGGSGVDALFGDDGDDELYGEQGNDLLKGGSGTNILNGGTGDDVAYYTNSKDQFDFELIGNTIVVKSSDDATSDSLIEIEFVQFGNGLFALEYEDANQNSVPDSLESNLYAGNSFHAGSLLLSFVLDAGSLGNYDISMKLIREDPPTFGLISAEERSTEIPEAAEAFEIGTPNLRLSVPSILVGASRYAIELKVSNLEALEFNLTNIVLLN